MSERKRSRVKVSSPFADVRVAPVKVSGSEVSNQAIEIRDDHGDWQCLNIHSSSYNLIPNVRVSEIIDDILIQTGQLWTPEREIWTGRYWAKLFRSDLEIDAPEVGDTLGLGLRVENSYDGSCQFRIVLMGFVLSCTNGMVSPRHFSSFSMKHIGIEEVSYSLAVARIRQGVDELEDILPLVSRLNRIPLTTDLVSQVANETSLPNREWGEICKLLGGSETAWDLMQCITHRLSHHGRGRAGILSEEQIGDYFLGRICNRAA
ncbi:MAG: hypothetical protein AVO35_12745 [Candidatus Aegiribacteria sp. MLS_C]|nr:MAG: hypothetical protein AVO35_12745 [Candidatus Aegiribacteria sp. MLS_C]